jgi:zinc and cadmium transporter
LSTLQLILAFTALSGALSALAAGLFLTLGDARRAAVLPHLVSFATGTLLGAAFLGLIPHALDGAGAGGTHKVGLALLLGILLFFVLEKFVLWRHCHADPCEVHSPDHAARDRASANLILIGDTFHNLLDGVLVAAAFMTDPHLGIVTALAVFAHEIPQEVGDLAILLHGGFSRRRAMTLNLVSSLTSVVGGLIAYVALQAALGLLPYALAFAASSFIYVAVADLIPGLHRRVDVRAAVEQIVFIAAGVALVYSTHQGMH